MTWGSFCPVLRGGVRGRTASPRTVLFSQGGTIAPKQTVLVGVTPVPNLMDLSARLPSLRRSRKLGQPVSCNKGRNAKVGQSPGVTERSRCYAKTELKERFQFSPSTSTERDWVALLTPLPHNAFVPQRALKASRLLLPHRALLPQSALLPHNAV